MRGALAHSQRTALRQAVWLAQSVPVTARYAFALDDGRVVAQGEIFQLEIGKALQLKQAGKITLVKHHYKTLDMALDTGAERRYMRRDLEAEE